MIYKEVTVLSFLVAGGKNDIDKVHRNKKL